MYQIEGEWKRGEIPGQSLVLDLHYPQRQIHDTSSYHVVGVVVEGETFVQEREDAEFLNYWLVTLL